jgi:hypothetical protein
MGGEHQDGYRQACGPDPAANFEATEIRQIPIQEYQVWGGSTADRNQATGAIVGSADGIALQFELPLEQAGDEGFIINNQDV